MAADCSKEKDVCYNCKRAGHVAKDCSKPKQDGQGLRHARERTRGSSGDGKRGKSSDKNKEGTNDKSTDGASERCRLCGKTDHGGWRKCPQRLDHCFACLNEGKPSKHDHSSCQFAIDKKIKN